jgi:hypothetical protein
MNNRQFIYENFTSSKKDNYKEIVNNFKNNSSDNKLKILLTDLIDLLYGTSNSLGQQQEYMINSFMINDITDISFGKFLALLLNEIAILNFFQALKTLNDNSAVIDNGLITREEMIDLINSKIIGLFRNFGGIGKNINLIFIQEGSGFENLNFNDFWQSIEDNFNTLTTTDKQRKIFEELNGSIQYNLNSDIPPEVSVNYTFFSLPTPTPIPTQSPTPTPTPIPTQSPTPTPIPTQSPTPTPIPIQVDLSGQIGTETSASSLFFNIEQNANVNNIDLIPGSQVESTSMTSNDLFNIDSQQNISIDNINIPESIPTPTPTPTPSPLPQSSVYSTILKGVPALESGCDGWICPGKPLGTFCVDDSGYLCDINGEWKYANRNQVSHNLRYRHSPSLMQQIPEVMTSCPYATCPGIANGTLCTSGSGWVCHNGIWRETPYSAEYGQ